MQVSAVNWKKWFLFCLGLAAGSAFCMKWMEGDFQHQGSLFTIIGLEITYPADKVKAILSGIDGTVKTILRYHLYFDFAFMAGVYPGIAAMCMHLRRKWAGSRTASLLLVMALLQLMAWGCDIAENWYLLKWLDQPDTVEDFGIFHALVYTKWLLALAGIVLILVAWLRKPGVSSTH